MKKVFSAEKFKTLLHYPMSVELPLWVNGADGQEVINGRVKIREPYNRYTEEVMVPDRWCDWLADDADNNKPEDDEDNNKLAEDEDNNKLAEDEDEPEDVVNHPKHYCREGGMESIDEMVTVFGREAVMNFCLCNVWKYRYRASSKNGEEDLKKSDWYMRKYKELKEENK